MWNSVWEYFSGTRLTGLKSQFHHSLAVWPWASNLAYLCLSFFFFLFFFVFVCLFVWLCLDVFWKFLQWKIELEYYLFICFSMHSWGRRQDKGCFCWLLCSSQAYTVSPPERARISPLPFHAVQANSFLTFLLPVPSLCSFVITSLGPCHVPQFLHL